MIYLLILLLDSFVGLLAFVVFWAIMRLGSAVKLRRVLGSDVLGMPLECVAALLLGIAAYSVGTLSMVSGPFWVASVVLIYPSSFIFYLIPAALADRVSEAVLFFAGSVSAVLFWAGLFWIAGFAGNKLALGVRNRLRAA